MSAAFTIFWYRWFKRYPSEPFDTFDRLECARLMAVPPHIVTTIKRSWRVPYFFVYFLVLLLFIETESGFLLLILGVMQVQILLDAVLILHTARRVRQFCAFMVTDTIQAECLRLARLKSDAPSTLTNDDVTFLLASVAAWQSISVNDPGEYW